MRLIHPFAKLAERPHFLVRRHPGHNVPGEAANDVGLLGWQGEFLITSAMIEAKV